MNSFNFSSCVAKEIERFISLRCLSGTDYKSQSRLLWYFDKFLSEQNIKNPCITRQVIDNYLRTLSQLSPRSQENRFSVVRQICKHIALRNPQSYIPDSMKMTSSKRAYFPYIFSHEEICSLLSAASNLSPLNSLRPKTYSTLIGLLYSTGMRISEVIALNLEDFNYIDKWIYVAEGKFRKSRFINLSVSTCKALQIYRENRFGIKPQPADSPLFINQRLSRVNYNTINYTFKFLLKDCCIPSKNHHSPRIHDLRHTFAVHRLLLWYRDGQNVNSRLPGLATYMGHVDISSTHVYLKPTAELLGEVNSRFHNYFLNEVYNQGRLS